MSLVAGWGATDLGNGKFQTYHAELRGTRARYKLFINLLKPTGYVMHQQFNVQQLYVLPTLYLCFVFI